MGLLETINNDLKQAMLAKEKEKLEALRGIKAALLLAATEKGSLGEVSDEAGLKSLQKLVKQRYDAAEMYKQQNRTDLADVELFQANVIEAYLPKQMSEEEITAAIKTIITSVGASSAADFGKVMGVASKQLSGKADGKKISDSVKKLLA